MQISAKKFALHLTLNALTYYAHCECNFVYYVHTCEHAIDDIWELGMSKHENLLSQNYIVIASYKLSCDTKISEC